MDKQNITLSLSKDILRKVKVMAARQGKSVSGLMVQVMEDLVARDEGYRSARQRHVDVLSAGTDLGTKGHAGWTRADLHD